MNLFFGIHAFAQAPEAPTLSIDTNTPTGLESVQLTGSELVSPSGEFHNKTILTVAVDENFETIYYTETIDILQETPIVEDEDLINLVIENSQLPTGRTLYARIQYEDSLEQLSDFSNTVEITLQPFENLTLIYSEDFESYDVDSVPEGWEAIHTTPDMDPEGTYDYHNPQLQSWSIQDLDFLYTLVYFPGWDGGETGMDDVLPIDSVLKIADGKSLHSDSGDYVSESPVYEANVLSPVFDFTDVTDIVLAFNSNYLQNQDNIAVLEYTLDGGSVDISQYPDLPGQPTGTWHPVSYYMDQSAVEYWEGGIDGLVSLEKQSDGTPYFYFDYTFADDNESYSTEDLGPYILPRLDDGTVDGKRWERFRLPNCDNQPSVRFRWMMQGTWSWYWGIDNVQIWGISSTPVMDWSIY